MQQSAFLAASSLMSVWCIRAFNLANRHASAVELLIQLLARNKNKRVSLNVIYSAYSGYRNKCVIVLCCYFPGKPSEESQ